MIKAIRHVGIVVSNLENALSFWRDILGFSVIRKMEEAGPQIDAMMGLNDVRVTTVKLVAEDGSMVELLKFHSHPEKDIWTGSPFSTGITHIALTVGDIDKAVREMKNAGVRFPADPQFSPDGKVKVIYASAPDGVLLELVEHLDN
ncbi:VOC family protein [Alphaproteobacteria bacterium LSUCC0744]